MRRLALIAVLMVAGCGSSDTPEPADEGTNAAVQERRDELQRKADGLRRRAERTRVASGKCGEQTRALQRKTGDLNSRLDVGLTYTDYSERVADIKVVYDRTDFQGAVELTCIKKVGLPLEKALNQYLDAYQTWNACIEDFGCDTDSISDDLQLEWLKASLFATRAEAGLRAMKKTAARFDAAADRIDQTAAALD